eukprot:TRINITY_DN68967_c0_g1_i1.p1 TRINITY_DN68967_c0_g1~~TRINITY_DN68967_c0_g1_i1.p1  ORF type:complete len:182 (-),score=15.08 TRINITY_DN68967_c0_g1_i1:217-762(-)
MSFFSLSVRCLLWVSFCGGVLFVSGCEPCGVDTWQGIFKYVCERKSAYIYAAIYTPLKEVSTDYDFAWLVKVDKVLLQPNTTERLVQGSTIRVSGGEKDDMCPERQFKINVTYAGYLGCYPEKGENVSRCGAGECQPTTTNLSQAKNFTCSRHDAGAVAVVPSLSLMMVILLLTFHHNLIE